MQTAGCNTGTAHAYGHRAWWNSKGSQQGLVEAAVTDLEHFRRFRGLEPAWQTVGLNAQRTEGWNSKGRGYVHANGRLHWNSTGLRPQLVEQQSRLTAGLGGSCRDGLEAF